MRSDPQFRELLQKNHRLRIADWHHVGRANPTLLQNFHGRNSTASTGLAHGDFAGKIDVFNFRQQVGKEPLVRFTELAKIVPSTSDICTNMKNDHALAGGVARAILFNYSHDAADKLNEGTQVRKYASNHRHREILMVEAFTQHSCLDNNIEIVIFELLENTIIGLTLAGMNIGCTKTASAERFRDLNAVIVIDSRSDDFEALFASALP